MHLQKYMPVRIFFIEVAYASSLFLPFVSVLFDTVLLYVSFSATHWYVFLLNFFNHPLLFP